MPRKRDTTANDYGVVACIAWLTTFVVTGVALFALMGAVAPAHAASPAPAAIPSALTVEGEDEAEEEGEDEEEFVESECEEAVAEFSEGEIDGEERDEICQAEAEEWGKAAAAGVLPEACVVRTFHPTAVASASRSQVQLTIVYTAYESTDVTIAYGLKGSPSLATAKRHLDEQGSLHFNKHLSDAQMKKLQSAHKLEVQIRIPTAPSRCQRYYSDSAKVHSAK